MGIEKQYNLIGKDYIKGQSEYFSKREGEARKFIRKFLKNVQKKKVLDVGCGSGEDILACEKLGAKEVYGIDISSFMIKEAKKRVSTPSNLKICDLKKINFESKFFDIVISRFSLNYIKNLNKAFTEIGRVLKKRGMLIIILPHPFRDLTLQKKKVYGKKEIINMDLYKNKVKVFYPSHSLEDYLSTTFFSEFDLREVFEESSPEEYIKKNNFITPGFLGIMAIKR